MKGKSVINILIPIFNLTLRKRLKLLEEQMDAEHQRASSKINLDIEKKLKLEKHSMYGYCFRVIGRTESSKIRNKSEYYGLSTQKAGTYFPTSKLRDLSSAYSDTSSEYDDK